MYLIKSLLTEKRLQSQDRLTYSKLLVKELRVNEVSRFCTTVIMHKVFLLYSSERGNIKNKIL